MFEILQTKNKKVFRLLKELTKKISFYIIEDLNSQDGKYTSILNATDHYFLISQEMTFEKIFEGMSENPTNHPHSNKAIIEPHSNSILSNFTNYNLFLCDSHG